jgi:hypothetical protein
LTQVYLSFNRDISNQNGEKCLRKKKTEIDGNRIENLSKKRSAECALSTELEEEEEEETRREMDAVEMASGAYKISKEKEK